MSRRVLTIVLAEATLDLLTPWAAAGKLPVFARLMAQGTWGRLRSQMPMVTPQICGTLVTGRSPGQHGLMDFWQRGHDGQFRETQGSTLRAPTIWQVLGEHGLASAILNLPFTYPPPPLKGFMIAGEDAPGVHPSIAQPRELLKEVTARFGRYHLKDTFPGGRQKSDYLTLIESDARAQTDVFAHLLATRSWDFGLIFFSHTAMCQHYFWADMESADPANPYRGVVESAYRALDTAVGRLIEAAGEDTNVLVVSDAGAGPLYSGVNLNTLLAQEGFLHYRAPSGGGKKKTEVTLPERIRRSALARLRKSPWYFRVNHYLKPLKAWMQSQRDGSGIDWSRTRASSRGQWGHIYINLKGRDPNGIVEPGDYDRVCAEIAEKLTALVDPARGEPAVQRVWRRDDLYHGPGVEYAPDLIVDWRDGAYMPNDRDRGESAVFAPRFRQYMSWPTTGSHRLDGVLIAAGPDIHSGTRLHGARLIDIMPTWLTLLGLPVPKELEGRPLYNLLERRKAS
ncbi:MAG TPA: alkaline phosphatase family protein [Steroidobacteraceae bacterium]